MVPLRYFPFKINNLIGYIQGPTSVQLLGGNMINELLKERNKQLSDVDTVILIMNDGTQINHKVRKMMKRNYKIINEALDNSHNIKLPMTLTEFANFLGWQTDRASLNRIGEVIKNGHGLKARRSNGRRVYDMPISEIYIVQRIHEAGLSKSDSELEILMALRLPLSIGYKLRHRIFKVINIYL